MLFKSAGIATATERSCSLPLSSINYMYSSRFKHGMGTVWVSDLIQKNFGEETEMLREKAST
jgi:hypothetical protein